MNTAELLRRARNNKGWSQAEAARRLGVKRATVNAWETGRAAPGRKNAPTVAKVYNLPLSAVAGDPSNVNVDFVSNAPHSMRRVPLLDWVDAGRGAEVATSHVIEATQDFVQPSFPVSDRAFALTVHGGSMEPDFREGDVIIVDPDAQAINGDFIVVELLAKGEQIQPGSGNVTFKQYRPRGTGTNHSQSFDLLPMNPDYPTITVNKDNPGRIIGKMIEHHRSYR